MPYDYEGDMSYFQDQLTAKGISKDQIDMNDYAGFTKSELQSIVDNYTRFIKKSADDKFNMLRYISTNVPDGFTEESYAKTIDWYSIFERTSIMTSDEVLLFRFIKTTDINMIEDLIKHVIHEYNSNTPSCQNYGTHRFWFDKLYEDKEFRPFALIASEVSPRDIWCEKTYLQMLLDEYNKL